MTTTSSVGICTACGAGFARGTAFCTACGAPVVPRTDGRVLAERAPATAVFGPPPAALFDAEPDAEPDAGPVDLHGDGDATDGPVEDSGPESGISLFRSPPVDPEPEPDPSDDAPPTVLAGTPVLPPDDDQPSPAAATRSPRSRRVLLVAAGSVVAVVLAGLWVASYLEDRPVRAALDDATTAYAGVVAAMAAAETLEDVAAVGDTARRAAPRLDNAVDDLDGDDDLAAAASRMVDAQVALVAAATPLADLGPESLEVWGQVDELLTEAGASVTTAKRGLAAVDAGAARAVPDPNGAIDSLREVVGSTAQDRLAEIVDGLLDRLGEAENTAQIRRIAEDAGASRAAVRAAAAGLVGVGADTAEAEAEAVTAFVTAVAALERLDRDSLGVWERVRARIVAARVTGVNVDPALESVDRLVARGQARMERWQKQVDRIRARQDADRATLAVYTDPVDAQLARYDELRSGLSSFFDRVVAEAGQERDDRPDGRYVVAGEDVAAVLTAAAQGRREVQAALRQVEPPAAYAEEHDGLVKAAKRGAEAVELAVAQLNDGCFDCDYADSLSYRTLSAASDDLSAEYSAATSAWRSAVGAARSAIEDRELPRKPVV